MAAHQSKQQKETVERVMHEFKEGELRIRGDGPKVKNPKQAIAIALHEAGASNQEPPAKNRDNLKKTKAKERAGETAEAEKEGKAAQDRTLHKATSKTSDAGNNGRTKADLYAEARERDIPGRSKMDRTRSNGRWPAEGAFSAGAAVFDRVEELAFQQGPVEGLHHIVRSTGLQRHGDGADVVFGGAIHHVHVFTTHIGAQELQELQPAHDRHVPVEQNGVGQFAPALLEGFLPVLCFIDDIVDVLENPPRHFPDNAGIVNNQAGFHGTDQWEARARLSHSIPAVW